MSVLKQGGGKLVFIGLLVMFFLGGIKQQCIYAQAEETVYTYNDFYVNLAPYGQWIDDAKYGYVWSPAVEGGFRPYFTNGHWSMTQYGNTWVSDYLWGWACFHYGRWIFDTYYGWLWIPGKTWGPAWVMWRTGIGYYGWAPLAPDFKFKPNVTPDQYVCPKDWWVFLPPQYLYQGNYYSYWSGPTGNSTILKNTTQLNNYYNNNKVTFINGPYAKQVEKVTKKPVALFTIGNSSNLTTKIHHDEIKMFRPAEIVPEYPTGNKQMPGKVVTATRPVTLKPESINAQKGKPSELVFKPEVTKNPAAAIPAVRQVSDKAKVAPQPPDATPYDWKNPDHDIEPASVEYKKPPKTHPDHGPVQQSDPLPKYKDPNPKKLPSQPTQNPDPIKPEDQKIPK